MPFGFAGSRHRGAAWRDTRHAGLGTVVPPDSTVIAIDRERAFSRPYVDVWEIMKAIKYNLMEFTNVSSGIALNKVKTWQMGFVFPRTVYPAISVFPVSRLFYPRRTGAIQLVENRFSIDIYSKRWPKLADAKKFCLEASDDVIDLLKRSIKMLGTDGYPNSFKCNIINVAIGEGIGDSGRGFESTASIEASFFTYHQMNTNRINETALYDTDYDSFFDLVVARVKEEAESNNLGIKEWATKVSKPILRHPAVGILPQDELVDEVYTGHTDMLVRPIQFYTITKGYPKLPLLKKNIELGDKLVVAIEKQYMIGGYAQDCEVESIDYLTGEGGLAFASVVNVVYRSRATFSVAYS